MVLMLAAFIALGGAILFVVSRRHSGRKALAFKSAAFLSIPLLILAVGASSLRSVPPGQVAVATLFGAVQSRVYDEGLNFVNPLYSLQEFSIRREMFDFSGQDRHRGKAGEEIVAVSSDSTPLTIDVGFPLRLNGPSAWRVFQRIGPAHVVARQLIIPAARAAVRDAVAEFTWRDASTTARDKLAQRIEHRFRELVQTDLAAVGFSIDDAHSTFTIQPVQLRKILPPEKVLNAVSEKIASEEDLQRQKTLTQIAEEEARRRQNEGRGVNNLFAELPQGFTPAEIRLVLGAIADKTRAEALMKAVETGQVNVVVMNGAQPAISVNPGEATGALARRD